MNGKSPDPDQNICRVTLDLPWDIAEALAEHGPAIIDAVRVAVSQRQVSKERRAEDQQKLAEVTEKNKKQWADLAQHCQTEIARRSNSPGQKTAILKALAVETGHSKSFLESVCRIYGTKVRKSKNAERDENIVQMYFAGLSNTEIAGKAGISRGTVSRVLTAQRDRIKSEQRSRTPPPPSPKPKNGVRS